MTLQQAYERIRIDELYGCYARPNKYLLICPQPFDDSGGRWYDVIDNPTSDYYVSVYAHPTSDKLMYYLLNNSRSKLANMPNRVRYCNKWMVMSYLAFVAYNRSGDETIRGDD